VSFWGTFLCLYINNKNKSNNEKKDTQDRAMRLAQRNSLIRDVFYELTNHEKYSFSAAYTFLGAIFGLNDRQLRKVALSADNLAIFVVILHRILKESQ
jgi:hypothetical protein